MTGYDLNTMTASEVAPRFGEHSPTGCDYFDYAPGQPNLYLMMRFKQRLVKEQGITRGFDLYKQVMSKQNSFCPTLRHLESHHDFSRARSLQFIEAVPAGETFTIMPPRVIGGGNHRPLTNTTRSFYISCLEGARVRGRSSIIEVGNAALADFQDEELARIDDELEFDSAVFHRDDEKIWLISQDCPALELDSAFSLLGCRTDFFGDWLCDYILKYAGASLAGLPPVPVLIDADMPKTHRQALELLLAPGTEIIEVPAFQPVQVRHLWSASSIGYMAFHQIQNERFKWDYVMSSPERFTPVQIEMLRRADIALGTARGPERVFLGRKAFRHRKLVNKDEIEAIAEAHGFAIVYPEELDFIEQVRLLRSARYVIGPEGSALFLCYFLGQGAKVCILNHPLTEALVGYNGGNRGEGDELTIITGPQVGPLRGSPQDMDYAIDANVFRGFLGEWLAGPLS